MANILVIDDQPCIREFLSEKLAEDGHTVMSVADAEATKAHVKAYRFDVVLLDLYLDGRDGWDVLQDIKRHAPSLPVLILTAYDSFRNDPRLSEAEGYVIKQVDLQELKEALIEILNKKRKPPGDLKTKGFLPQIGRHLYVEEAILRHGPVSSPR